MKRNDGGFLLVGVLAVMIVLMILIPALIGWVGREAKWTVKEQKNTTAFNLAEAGVDRGMWKLKSSTVSWANATAGTVVAGYNFDTVYNDVEGGRYRIRFTSTVVNGEVAVVVHGEGKDTASSQTRAIQAIFINASFPGPVLSQGVLTASGTFEAHWGPLMSQNNINIVGSAASDRFPRKFSKQIVQCTVAGWARDTSLSPPNTDNVEWWSAYDVPDLPQLDFATMRSSAAANGTLNYYNVNASSTAHLNSGAFSYTSGDTCQRPPSGAAYASHNSHFFASNRHPQSKNNLIWYWDNNVVFTGPGNSINTYSTGFWGTIVVMGNLTIDDTNDSYSINNAPIPANAWREYAAIDTAATDQYPGDNGLRVNNTLFDHGSETWTGGPTSSATDVGLRGLIYVGGNFTITADTRADLRGVLWVKGTTTNAATSEKVVIYYERPAGIPVLNVVLRKESWKEVPPTSGAW
jgi:hypothetical protein